MVMGIRSSFTLYGICLYSEGKMVSGPRLPMPIV